MGGPRLREKVCPWLPWLLQNGLRLLLPLSVISTLGFDRRQVAASLSLGGQRVLAGLVVRVGLVGDDSVLSEPPRELVLREGGHGRSV